MKKLTTIAIALFSILLLNASIFGQVSFNTLGTPVTQNFDGLGTANFNLTDNTSITGVYAFRQTGNAVPNVFTADNGGSNTGRFNNYGTTAATDRALGSASSGTPGTLNYGVRYLNNTGTTITSLSITYTGEQWRNEGNATAQVLAFDYRQAATVTDLTSGTYTGFAALNFTSLINTASAAALDGNSAANRTTLTQTVNVTIPAGQEIMIRWSDINDAGNDHGFGIDDLSVTPNGSVTPDLSINDVTVNEGNAGTTNFSFTVSLSTPAPAGGVTFDIATADNTATTADNDYVQKTLTGQTIAAGSSSYTFDVTVNGDTVIESTESFFVNVTNVTGANVTDGQGLGTITNDDLDTTPPTVSYTPLSNISSVSDRTFDVTATDNVGVTAVSVVWANNGGASGSLNAPCSFVSGTTWSCTILSGVGMPPQTNQGTVSYFVSATDAAGNSSTNPTGGTLAGGTRNLFTVGFNGTIDVSVINTFDNLNIGSGFTLNGNATVNGVLTFSGGVLNTGANTLTLGCNATVAGAGSFNYIIGNVEKLFCGTGSFTYPVGTAQDNMLQGQLIPEGNPTEYTPFVANVTAGTFPSSLTVSVTDDFLPGSQMTESVSRYWNVTETGDLTADITFTYLNQDVNGTETGYQVLRRATTTAVYPGGTVSPETNTGTALGVSNFSGWTAGTLAPTAANVSLGGRVITANGQGIRNATVVISGGGLTAPRYATTGTFGNYQFESLPVGESYIVTVVSKKFTFQTPSIVVNLQDNAADINFTAEDR